MPRYINQILSDLVVLYLVSFVLTRSPENSECIQIRCFMHYLSDTVLSTTSMEMVKVEHRFRIDQLFSSRDLKILKVSRRDSNISLRAWTSSISIGIDSARYWYCLSRSVCSSKLYSELAYSRCSSKLYSELEYSRCMGTRQIHNLYGVPIICTAVR
jgi:hypothetical protein